MTRPINRDATSVILTVIVLDSDGAAVPDIAWNDPDLAIHWRASAGGSWTEITRSEGTVGTWSSGGWVHLGLGVYQLGLPNAAVVAGDRTIVRLVYDEHPPQYAAIDAVLYPSVDVSGDVAAIKAKTDNLPAQPAAVGSAMTLTPGERTSISDSVWTRGTRTITTEIPTANQTRDAVWAAATRTLTGNPGLDAAGMRSALGMSSANLDTQIVGVLDAIDQIPGGGGGLDAAGVRAAIGLASANLDTQLAGIVSDIGNIPGGGGGGGGLSKADVRDAIGMDYANLDTQLADILEAISDIEVGGNLPGDIADEILPELILGLSPYLPDVSLGLATTAEQFVITAKDDYAVGDVLPVGPIRMKTTIDLLRAVDTPTLRFGATRKVLGGVVTEDMFVGLATATAVPDEQDLYDILILIEKAELHQTPGVYGWDVEVVFPDTGHVQTILTGDLTLRRSMGNWEDRD